MRLTPLAELYLCAKIQNHCHVYLVLSQEKTVQCTHPLDVLELSTALTVASPYSMSLINVMLFSTGRGERNV